MNQQIQQTNLKYKTTTKVMRKTVKRWRDEVIEKHPYCFITGSVDLLEVHHAGLSFNQIFRQAHENLGIQYHKYIFEYNTEDVKALKKEIIRLHGSIEAVVLTHDIHVELHQIYGTEVSMEQIKQYKEMGNQSCTKY